jgi:hypothetical protein
VTLRHLLIISALSLATALTIGWIDYETKTVGDLFRMQNLPALAIFAAMAFVLLTVAWLGVVAVTHSVRSERRR